MSKKQRGSDKPDDRGNMPPELSTAIALAYPDASTTQHYYEPYTPLAGPIADVTPHDPPKKKKAKKKDAGPLTDAQVEVNTERRRRYDTFMDYLVANAGDTITALSLTYGVPSEEIKERLPDYKADVALGITTSSVSDILEEVGLGKRARIGMLRHHAYSADPKVSLVALKLATDLDGDKHDHGTTYEAYIRMIKGRK